MTKRPIEGSYCYTKKDLVTPVETIGQPKPSTDFDTPHTTTQGVPIARLSVADEIAEKLRKAKEAGGIITDLEKGKKHLTDNYPAVGSLLIELERIHRTVETERQRGLVTNVLQTTADDKDQSADLLEHHEPLRPKDVAYKAIPPNIRNLDAVIRDYLGNGDSAEVDADIKLEDLKVEVATEPEIEPAKKSQREDITLIMPVMDENGVVKTNLGTQVAAIQEFAKEFEEKTGSIELKQTILDRIRNIIDELKKMDLEERQRKFPNLPLSVRKQILKFLSIQAAEKEAKLMAPVQKEWPPITMTVTLGKKVHAEIRLAHKKR